MQSKSILFSANIVFKVLRSTVLLIRLTFSKLLLSLKPFTCTEIGSFISSPSHCKGWKKQALNFKGAWVWYTPLFSFIVLLVSGRYVDGARHFTYCHFWAYHAALGRCQDNWGWWHPKGQSSLQRSTEMWVTADIKGWCFTVSNPNNRRCKLTTWWMLESDIRVLSCYVFMLCCRFLYFISLWLLSGLLAVKLQKGLKRKSIYAIGIAVVFSLDKLSNI